MMELWIFLNRLSKLGIRSIRGFFNTSHIWLSENEELRKYDGQDYTAASMLTFFLFAKLSRRNVEEALDSLSSNKSYMKLIGFEKVPTKGTKIFEQAAELGEDKFKEVMLKTKEYEPKTANGKAAKDKRDENSKKPAITITKALKNKQIAEPEFGGDKGPFLFQFHRLQHR